MTTPSFCSLLSASRSGLRPILLVLFVSLGLTILAGCASTKEVPAWKQGDMIVLEARPNAGDNFTLTMEMDQSVDMSMMGQSIPMDQKQTYNYLYNIVEVDEEGVFMLEQELSRIRGSVESSMMGSQSFDTDDGEAGQVGEQMKAMIGVPIRARLTKKGEVVSVEGVEDLQARMSEEAFDEAQRKILEDALDPETFAQNLQTFSFYPDAPIAVGDSWTTTSSVRLGFPMTLESTYTLTRVEGTTAYLDVAVDTYTPDDAEPMAMGGGEMTMDMTGTMTGTAEVDLPSGLMTTMTTDQSMEADATVEAQGRTMDMQMSITGTMTQTLSGVPEATGEAAQASE